MVDAIETGGDAPTRFDKLLSGVACELPSLVNPDDNRGKEHLTPEDTFDGDYGRLLERAYDGKGLASPRGILPFTMRGAVMPMAA